MVDKIDSTTINGEHILNYSDFVKDSNYDDNSIFNVSDYKNDNSVQSDVDALNEELLNIENNQGCFSKSWSKFKDITGLGLSNKECQDVIEQYKNGEISFEEAAQTIEKYKSKQESSLNLFSNIATSFTAIAAGTAAAAAIIASGGTATPFVIVALAGAGAGAITKAGFKFTDRATNKVEGDALDAKEISKDALSGAVTGAIAGATMGNGTACSTLKESILVSSSRAAKTGLIAGAASGASNYSIDCAFDEDIDFNAKDFAKNTAENALIGATVGGIMGSANGTLRSLGIIKHGGMVKSGTGLVQNASSHDIVANSVCSAEYKLVNDRIRNIKA